MFHLFQDTWEWDRGWSWHRDYLLDLLLEERDLYFKTRDQLSHEWKEQWVKDFISSQLCQQICFCTNFLFLVSMFLLNLMAGSKRKLVDLDLIPQCKKLFQHFLLLVSYSQDSIQKLNPL